MSLPVYLMVARQSGTLMQGRRRHVIRRGVTIAHPDHKLVRDHPRAWEPLRVHYDVSRGSGTVEQATAVPGSRRALPPPPPEPDPAPPAETGESPEAPRRPPLSGAGSGVDAWRRYAAAVSGSPVESWAAMSREDIVAALKAEGVDGQPTA